MKEQKDGNQRNKWDVTPAQAAPKKRLKNKNMNSIGCINTETETNVKQSNSGSSYARKGALENRILLLTLSMIS